MEYILKTTKDELYNNGFRYNKLLSDDGIDCYSICFPVLKYNKKITMVECELTVELQTNKVFWNVVNHGTHDAYAPYYNRNYGVNIAIESIDKNIQKFLQKIGAKKKR